MHPTDQAAETDPHKTHSFEAVLDAEMRGMAHLRQDIHRENLIGLAFSGGGIRSATLNLGILQGLAKKCRCQVFRVHHARLETVYGTVG